MGVEVEVEYDYDAELCDELSIRCGDVITDVKQMSGGWWEGILSGKRGLFPENFVKVLKSGDDEDVPLRRKADANANAAAASARKRCKVLFSYRPTHEDELELKIDDVLDFMGEVEDGWWKGRGSSGSVGVFPSNFVEVIASSSGNNEDDDDDAVVSKKNLKNDTDGIAMRASLPADILRVQNGKRPKAIKETRALKSKDDNLISNAPKLPPKPVKEVCHVLYPYTALNEDELTLAEGQIVTVISKEVEDKGWWKGELEGRIGVFPDNFVKLLPGNSNADAKQQQKPNKPTIARPGADAKEKVLEGDKRERKVSTGSSVSDKSERSGSGSGKSSPRVDDTGSLKKPSQVASRINKLWPGGNRNSTGSVKALPAKDATPKKHSFGKNAAAPQRPAKASSFSQRTKKKPAATTEACSQDKRMPSTDNGLSTDSDGSDKPKNLTHLTAMRPKGPKRRPPSSAFHKEESPSDLSDKATTPPADDEEGKLPGRSSASGSHTSLTAALESAICPEKMNSALAAKPTAVAFAAEQPVVKPTAAPSSSTNNKPGWLQELSRKQASRSSEAFEKPPDPSARQRPQSLSQQPPEKPNVPLKPLQIVEKESFVPPPPVKPTATTRLSEPPRPAEKPELADKLLRKSDPSTHPPVGKVLLARRSFDNQLNSNHNNGANALSKTHDLAKPERGEPAEAAAEGSATSVSSSCQSSSPETLEEKVASFEQHLVKMENQIQELRRELDEERVLRIQMETELKLLKENKSFL